VRIGKKKYLVNHIFILSDKLTCSIVLPLDSQLSACHTCAGAREKGPELVGPIPHGPRHGGLILSSSTVSTSSEKKAPTPSQPQPNYFISALVVVIGVIASIVILKLPALSSPWQQTYDPIGNWFVSTLVAAIPIGVLLGVLAFGHVKAHYAALAGLVSALLVYSRSDGSC
jgi:hypothetical protein